MYASKASRRGSMASVGGKSAAMARLVTDYFSLVPDPAIAAQRVAFGTSGHRGSAFSSAFNESTHSGDSPLRVDPYAELASAIASQSFKTITS